MISAASHSGGFESNSAASNLTGAHLVVLTGGVEGKNYSILSDRLLTIGRDPEADIPLTAKSVSRRHAEVEFRNGHKFWIRDLGSRNGVEVNGRKIDRAHRLQDGETIKLAQAQLKFVDTGSVEAALQEKEFIKATRDSLTGLYNRRFMEEILIRMLSEHARREASLAIVFMDLDHFKRINQEHGERVADELLRKVAAELKKQFRTTDLVARFGGDEFAILLPDTDAKTAHDVIEKIQSALLDLGSGDLPKISLSAGAAGFVPQKHASVDVLAAEMIKSAEEAVYMAKQRGRNRVVGFGKH